MSDYSGYQIKRTHAQGPFASVHEATAPTGGPGRFALKIFHPPASTNIRRAYAIEGFLLAAERQQKAFKKDGAVVEVLAFGRCAEGAYMVMPWHERSFEPLVANLAAKGDLLRSVAELLFNTLEQWAAQTGGAHRKLKPSNIFVTKPGPLPAMSAALSDAWFMFGAKAEASRVNDLAAVGAMLAQIVRRREVAAWPIEDAPEWRALGRAGKAWLAYVNYLMDPQPAAGELTIAEARKRLKAIPKDSNPVKTTLIISGVAAVLMVGGVAAFARFGNPIYMPGPIYQLAVTLRNPAAYRKDVTQAWPQLVRAWDTWLGDLQGNAPRLLRNEKLWSGPQDPLRLALQDFVTNGKNWRPEVVVPEVGSERRVGVLVDPPEPLRTRILAGDVSDRVDETWRLVLRLAGELERWPRWGEMRELQGRLEARGFTRAVAALQPKLPQAPGTPGYKLDTPRTTRLFNDVSLDENGTLLLARSWAAITRVRTEMEGETGDRVQNAMPRLILEQLRDTGSLGNFAESLGEPLDELTRRRQRFMDPQVVRERFKAESPLLKETTEVTTADFPRWEEQLELFTKVPQGEDPRFAAAINPSVEQLSQNADELEADAPEPEPGGLPTLSRADFDRELAARRTELQQLRTNEIVRKDLPDVAQKTNQFSERVTELGQRVAQTLILLNPQTWLDKVRGAFGGFNETRQRWAAWQQAAVPPSVTADSLRGAANRQRFRELRAQERQVKEFINGLEGPDGLAALTVPDLGGFTPETAEALKQLEAARREQAASAAAAAVGWRNGLPQVTWAAAGATVREPIAAHREWLAALPAFATDLDRLAELLAGGFGWTEEGMADGVREVVGRLAPRPGVDTLTGKPAESYAEAKLLGELVASNDRAVLVGGAQSGKLSRMFTAWRRLGTLAGWPANAADLDVDGGVVETLRKIVPETVRDETRRGGLLDELGRETRVRWNRAARNSASSVEQMAAVFERMAKYGISETDLEDEARANLFTWQFKQSDWGEVELPPLRARRDEYVAKMRTLTRALERPELKRFVDEIAGINLVADKTRPVAGPRTTGWKEEMTDAGLGLTATWNRAGKTVKLDFTVIQPEGDLQPFYLARRALAVGEFLDLMASARSADAEEVMKEMPQWAQTGRGNPYDQPMAWWRNPDTDRLEVSPSWILNPTALVNGLFINDELRRANPTVNQAAEEKPSPRSPLQQIPPGAARIFLERMLGARLPTVAEWNEVMKAAPPPPTGIFRGENFQKLFAYLRDYNEAGQKQTWRPNTGAFRVMVTTEGGRSTLIQDDGAGGTNATGTRLWLAPVDEGPAAAGGFINLTGNVWIYLQGETPTQFYAAGGSALSPPEADPTKAYRIEAGKLLIGAKKVSEGFADVGVRPAFEAPPGFKERFKLLELVRKRGFLTW